jgi:hypothetical protein
VRERDRERERHSVRERDIVRERERDIQTYRQTENIIKLINRNKIKNKLKKVDNKYCWREKEEKF